VLFGLSALKTEIGISEDETEVVVNCYGALKLVRAALRRRASQVFWMLELRLLEEPRDDDDG